jgi:internalin A
MKYIFKYALSVIGKAEQSNWDELNLNSTLLNNQDLTELFPKNAQFKNLKKVSLKNNQLTELPEEILQMTNLQILDLSGNEITKVPERIVQLINLQELNLGFNGFTTIPKSIMQLTNLRTLNLSHNQISELPIEILQLQFLQNFYFSRNKINELPDYISFLTTLKKLDLSHNQLGEIPKTIGQLTNLEWLNYSSNRLKVFSSHITQLINIKTLNLFGNQISELPENIQQLTNLEWLNLNRNQLPIPEKILENSANPQAILKYYFDYIEAKQAKSLKSINEGRIILIGQGNVGKTSLRKCLIENKCDEKQTKTEGLEIKSWNFKDEKGSNIKLNIWDFGGQEIYHTTHQFFFNSNCLYILVADFDERVEWRTNRVEYWLKTIQLLVGESKFEGNNEMGRKKTPVIIVGNKADFNQKDKKTKTKDKWKEPIDCKLLANKYQNLDIISFYPVSCHVGINIENLRKAIKTQLKKIGVYKKIPPKYLNYKREIENDERDYILRQDFDKICPEDTDTMYSILNAIGVITAFGENRRIKSSRLKELIVLKPQWITKGIYRILSANHLLDVNNGEATKEEIRGQLDERIYPSIEDIIEMMKEFYLCFRRIEYGNSGSEIEKYIFPSFFSVKRPISVISFLNEISESKIVFQYKYNFLSDNVISFFIIKINEKKYQISDYWKYGVIIIHHSNKAIIESDLEENTITITIKGKVFLSCEYFLFDLKRIFDEIHAINFIPKPIKSNTTEKKEKKELRSGTNSMDTGKKKVFIVHGHDNVKEAVARFIEKAGLEVIILKERPSRGKTIIEQLEDYSDVDFAVVLLTPDDVGGLAKNKGNSSELLERARQNVILELGFMMGKLGRSNVCVLHKGNIELPSDYQGVIYIEIDNNEAWKQKLAREIKEAGLEVDMNKLF